VTGSPLPGCGRDQSGRPCKGHRRYVGGPSDGLVSHLLFAHPSDYPMYEGSMLIGGTRNWYEIDYEASVGVEAVYRFIGMGRYRPGQDGAS
jgi:hypothetical protein